MKKDFTLLWGVLLILAGLLFLAQTWSAGSVFPGGVWAGVWAAIFTGAGLTFGWVFVTDPSGSWWAAIPGMSLLALGMVTGAHSLGWDTESAWLGSLFLGMIGLSFWLIYAFRRDCWWAIIPGGALFTLAAVALVSTWAEGIVAGAVFFFGLALTFGLVAVLPAEHGRMGWALYPAVVLAILGVVVLLSLGSIANYLWPLSLIAAGLWLLYRQISGGEMFRRR
jgi:hypothetical protein